MNPLLPVEYLAILLAALLAAVGVFAWRSTALCPVKVRWAVVLLRFAAVGCLAAIAFNPGRWHEDEKKRDSEWAVLVDSSLSMGATDVNGGSRWKEACRLSDKVAGMKDVPPVKFFTFASRLQPVESAKQLGSRQCDGETTDILRAGNGLLDIYQPSGRRLRGIILLSDGHQVGIGTPDEFVARARSLQAPVFPLGLGGRVDSSDLSISPERRHYVGFKGRPLKITARLDARGFENIHPVVQLWNEKNQKVAERTVEISRDSTVSVDFEITPEARGYDEYTLKVPPWTGESILVNNQCRVGVSVLDEKIRVLFVEGMPGWDSKFIVQLLQKQNNVQLTSIYRISSEKYFSIESGETQADETSESAFPKDAAAFRKYDLVIFGRGVEYFLTPEKIQFLKQFVKEQGGGILFARGKPYESALPDLEPLEPASWGPEVDAEFRWAPTVTGEEAGLFGEMLPGMKDPIWKKLPPLSRAQECLRFKPFTQVLAAGAIENGGRTRTFPAVLSQRYGKGLVITVNLDGLWQWDFFPAQEGSGKIYRDFWAQIVLWAITYSDFLPGQEYALKLGGSLVSVDEPVTARVLKRNPGQVKQAPILRISQDGQVTQEVTLPVSLNAPDQWEGVFSVGKPGTYRVELVTDSPEGRGRLHELLQVKAPVSEKDDTSRDDVFLNLLAEKTGGRPIKEGDLGTLLQPGTPPEQIVQKENAEWEPRWSRGGVLLILMGLFAAEWFLRRRNGLI